MKLPNASPTEGASVNHRTSSAQVPSPRTGTCATLAGKRRGTGSGAPSRLQARVTLAALCASLAILALTAAPALALNTHVFSTSFGSAGSGDGQLALAAHSGLAVNTETGDVYLADTENHRVDLFDEEGNFIRAFGADVGGAGIDVCTTGCGAGTSSSAPGGFGAPAFLAVDNSAGLSKGDVYVADSADNLVSKFEANGTLIASWGAAGQLAGNGSEAFGELAGIAVEGAGNLDVLRLGEPHRLFRFQADGSFLTEFETERGNEPAGLALAPNGNIFKVNGDGTVEEFGPTGSDIGQVTINPEEAHFARGFAIDPASGDLYVDDQGKEIDHYAFNGSGEVIGATGACPVEPHGGPDELACPPTDSFGSGQLEGGAGLAVAPDHTLYAADAIESKVDVFAPIVLPDVSTGSSQAQPTTATLKGTVNPDEIPLTECLFEWGTDETYGHSAECEPNAAAIGEGNAPVEVEAQIEGLQVGTTYHYRLVAANANGQNQGADLSFETPPPPSIDAAEATEVTATSAKLNTEINPRGAETTCQIEWGPTAEPGNPSVAYENTDPCEPPEIIAANFDFPASLHLEGLSPDTSYHWRVAATNASGTTTGVEHTFVFLSPPEHESCSANEAFRTGASANLPDCRAYELVTPPHKNGSLPGANFVNVVPTFSADGSRMLIGSLQCFAEAPSCSALNGGIGTPYMYSRTAAGWVTGSLAPPPQHFVGATNVSPDTGMVLYSIPTPPFGENDLYAQALDGSLTDIGPVSYPPLGKPGPAGHGYLATADFSHVAVQQISEQVGFPFDESQPGPDGRTVYEYAGTGHEPFLVAVSGGRGSTALISRCRSELGAHEDFGGNDSALSADGRTVYFTAGPCSTGTGENAGKEVPADELYARIDGETEGKAHTVHISAPQCGAGEGAKEKACRSAPPANASFQGASRDGSLAFFASTRQLTDEASEDSSDTTTLRCWQGTGPNGCNLYLYDLSAEAGQRLIDVSAGDTSGTGPQVQGLLAFSADGTHAYFLANGVLAANEGADDTHASPGDCRYAPDLTQGSGSCNLYLYQRDAAHPAGQIAYIATLPGTGYPEWVIGADTANVTPDGRFLLFSSTAHLTPDDHASTRQIFRYDAQSGALDRVSIGERGFNDNGNSGVGEPRFVPASKLRSYAGNNGRSNPSISDDGQRVFFQSPIGLTPGAFDDRQISEHEGEPQYAQNIYEYHGGHVSLITDGRDTTPVTNDNCVDTAGFSESTTCLIGTDASGNDVFFSSGDRLAPQDTDTGVDYYDARIDGGFAASTNITLCQTSEACHPGTTAEGPASSPSTPGFNGPEEDKNHPICARGYVKKHGSCVKRPKKKHKHKRKPNRHRQASHKGGGQR
jgi:DNA-binding beta-propeller fold protein YncE